MSVTSTRKVTIGFSGDYTAEITPSAAANSQSPGDVDIVTLAIGDNTIPPPSGGSTPRGLTIIPPVGNSTSIKLKGAGGDTGIELHPSDPTSIGLNSVSNNVILNVATQINNVRLVWS